MTERLNEPPWASPASQEPVAQTQDSWVMTEAKSMAETHWSRWCPSSISLTFPIENLQAVLNFSHTVSHRLRE